MVILFQISKYNFQLRTEKIISAIFKLFDNFEHLFIYSYDYNIFICFINFKKKKIVSEIMMVMYKNYMGCKTRYIRRVNVIKTINGNVYPLVLFPREVFACGQKYKWVAFI